MSKLCENYQEILMKSKDGRMGIISEVHSSSSLFIIDKQPHSPLLPLSLSNSSSPHSAAHPHLHYPSSAPHQYSPSTAAHRYHFFISLLPLHVYIGSLLPLSISTLSLKLIFIIIDNVGIRWWTQLLFYSFNYSSYLTCWKYLDIL